MIQIDLSKYAKKFTALYDIKLAEKISKEYNIGTNFEDVELIVPGSVLTVSLRFFYNLLNERFYNYPLDGSLKKSIKLTTKNTGIQKNFKEAINDLMQERKTTDMKLRIKVK